MLSKQMLKPVISTIENTLQQALAAASNAECRAHRNSLARHQPIAAPPQYKRG